jgi:hypothetical protein
MPVEILRSILKQLSATRIDLPIREPVVKAYKEKKDEADMDSSPLEKLSLQESVKLILALLADNSATIIIDALDECLPALRHELLTALDKIIQESPNIVKVLVSSRDDKDIVIRLKDSRNVYISAGDNSGDIERFVRTRVVSAIQDRRLLGGDVSNELKDHIIETLIVKAEGM